MKRFVNSLILFMLLTLSVSAQDFKLFYAKNVTDVTQFRNLTELDKQLSWREVSNGSIDGNLDDVKQVKDMLSQSRMKGIDDQQLFWKMRDEMLLCFRIDDPNGKNSTFRVEVNYGKNYEGNDIKRTLTTRQYFFANMPLSCDSVAISVWRVKDPMQRIDFRYWVYDWNDDNVYIFQLDQKRQSTGDTYKMEYVTSYADQEGDVISESHVLELKETKFQSFYVPEGHSLTDVYFLTGNDQEGNVKLRMDMDDIHPGIDIDHQLEVPSLLPTFKLAKHENREMMNFNWVGTGLFEKYDTLFIKLFNEKAKNVSKAKMNVHRVDDDGALVNDNTLRYLGYDARSKCHKVLTFGHPAFVEILVDDYLPMIYRYKGAADKMTNIVSSDLCSAKITLRKGDANAGSIAVADQHFRFLHDETISVSRITATKDTIDYAVCSLKEAPLAEKLPSDNVAFMDNAGNDYPKLYNNKPIGKFAQFEIAFSAPKGGSSPQSTMTVTEVESKKTHTAVPVETDVVAAAEFTNFTRDYYFVRYDMSDAIPYNKTCALTLSTPNATYKDFPMFTNNWIDNEEQKKKAEKKTAEITSPPDGRDAIADFSHGFDWKFMLPLDLKFSTPGLTIKAGSAFNFWEQTFNVYLTAFWTWNNQGKNQEQEQKLKGARDNAKEVQNWKYADMKKLGDEHNPKTISGSAADVNFKYDDWIQTEMESLFNVTAKHVGWYGQIGGKVAFKGRDIFADFALQLAEANLYGQVGYGMCFTPKLGEGEGWLQRVQRKLDNALRNLIKIDLVAQFDINGRLEAGVKSYGKKNEYEWSSEDKGFYTNFTITALGAAWFGLKTKKSPLFNIEANLRAGCKLQFAAGLMFPFSDQESNIYAGIRGFGLGGAFAHLAIRTPLGGISLQGGFELGGQLLYPNNDHNPFHTKFPFWLPNKPEKKARLFRTLAAPQPNELGHTIVSNVAPDANPHFLTTGHVVYNNQGSTSDYNDDQISLATLSNDQVTSTETLSVPGTAATQHMRSKIGNTEVVVYQQTTKTIDNAAVTDETAMAMDIDIANHSKIMAAIRQTDGTWKQTVVAPEDGMINRQPVATAQEDGKVAVLYQRGTIEAINPEISIDSIDNQCFNGELLLRTYDPATGWSKPTNIFDYNEYIFPVKYDLIMRNDTVLVGAMLEEPYNPQFHTICGKYTRYAWKPVKSDQVLYAHEDLRAVDFFMNRVGEHGVVSMIYERPDTLREIYIKTLNMDGTDDGLVGCDLGIGRSMPNRLKIITDRSDENSDDFAVLWTEGSTTIRDIENGNKALKGHATVINAIRVRLSETPQMTYPLTVAAERENTLMGDFDGYLDDAFLQVAYTLTDTLTLASSIIYNEKEFTNGFQSDVTYSREALLGSSTLPVNVYIRNTGTSTINAATVTINGQDIVIPNVLVQPLEEQKYVVQYPITDDFDGYMQSSVEVEYANVFKARQQTRRRAAPRNLLRQSRAFGRQRVAAGEIDCHVVSRSIADGVNTFIVEIIDRSSRGLMPGTAIQVGAYMHPSVMETVYSGAKTLVYAEDFTRMGAVRKAFAELTVSGITEPIDGYIAAHIVDQESTEEKESDDDDGVRIENASRIASPSYVLYHPTGEATRIDVPVTKAVKDHRVTATAIEGGIMLGNLEAGDDIRLFASSGLTVYMGQASATTHFVPLKRHDVYVISASKEVFKFTY